MGHKRHVYADPVWVDSIRALTELPLRDAPDKHAYEYKNENGEVEAVTFKEFYDDTEALGAALTDLGFSHSHIACIGENSYKWIVCYLTVLKSAGVFVPIDRELPEGDIVNLLQRSESEVVFYSGKFEKLLMEKRAQLPGVKCFVGLQREEDDGEFLSFTKLIEKGKTLDLSEYKKLESDPDELKLLVFTSGTTGIAKGVMLTEHNLTSGVYYGLKVSRLYGRGLSVLPYNHTYEAVCDILVAIHQHVTLCINESLRSVVKNMQLYKPDSVYLVPAFADLFYANIMRKIKSQGKEKQFAALVKTSNALLKVGIDLRRTLFKSLHDVFGGNLKKIVCGGAPIRPEIGKFFGDIGIYLTGGYGITECSPLVSVNDEHTNNYNTAGYRLECLEWSIDSPNEEGIGEICVRGDVVMKGYYKDPEKTAEVLRDGWFYTGDYGRITEDDQIMITGRKKNIIVLTNGKNIYPEEIEGYIQNIDYISEVVVRGIKNAYGEEEALLAEIYLGEEERDADAVLHDVRDALKGLPGYKSIAKVVIRKEPFPKTTTNKIKRN